MIDRVEDAALFDGPDITRRTEGVDFVSWEGARGRIKGDQGSRCSTRARGSAVLLMTYLKRLSIGFVGEKRPRLRHK